MFVYDDARETCHFFTMFEFLDLPLPIFRFYCLVPCLLSSQSRYVGYLEKALKEHNGVVPAEKPLVLLSVKVKGIKSKSIQL